MRACRPWPLIIVLALGGPFCHACYALPPQDTPPESPRADPRSEEPASEGESAERPAPQEIMIEIPADEPTLSAWIRERYAQIPVDLSGLRGELRTKVFILVDSLVVGGARHVKIFPESKNRTDVLVIYTHVLSLNRARHLDKLSKEYKEFTGERMPPEEASEARRQYYEEIHAVAEEALGRSPPAKQVALLHQVRGETFMVERRFSEAVEAFRKALELEPDSPRLEQRTLELGQAQVESADHAGATATLTSILERWPCSKACFDATNLLSESFVRSGRLDAGTAFWRERQPVFRAGAQGKPMPWNGPDGKPWVVPEPERAEFRAYDILGDFNLAYLSFARLDYEATRKGFETFLEQSDGYSHVRVAISRSSLALPYHTTLTGLIGKSGPALDIGDGWARPIDPAAPPPAATFLLFTDMGDADARRAELMPLLPRLAASRKEPVRTIWLVPLERKRLERRNESLEDHKQTLLGLAGKFGITGPVGFDLDKAVHEAYFIPGGGAHIFVLDRHGGVAWHDVDPMGWDEGLLSGVLERVIAR